MGHSADAILFYGYTWEEDDVELFGEDDTAEWDEVLAHKRGVPDPYADAPPQVTVAFTPIIHDGTYAEWEAVGAAWMQAHRDEIDAWYDAKRELAKSYPVDIGYHGSSDYNVPFIYVKDKKKRTSWGEAEAIPAGFLETDTYDDEALAEFVEMLGIDVTEAKGPAWFLVSHWG